MTDAGYAALFAWSFLAATILPVGSEVMVAVMIHAGAQPLPVIIVATLGNTLGAMTTYALGRAAARRVNPTGRAARALAMLERYGKAALLFSWLPVIGDAIVAAAGAARVPFTPFVFLVATGKLARYAALAYGARALIYS